MGQDTRSTPQLEEAPAGHLLTVVQSTVTRLNANQVERKFFFSTVVCSKHRKINRKWPEMAPFSLCPKARSRETLVIFPSEVVVQSTIPRHRTRNLQHNPCPVALCFLGHRKLSLLYPDPLPIATPLHFNGLGGDRSIVISDSRLGGFAVPWASQWPTRISTQYRERKIRTNFFCTNFLNTPMARVQDIPANSPAHPRFLSSKPNEDKLSRERTNFFGHHPFEWKTPTPPGGLRTQKVNLCALFSYLLNRHATEART